ncbi:hypothetical protein ACFPAF_16490 [Hymenobacter endophyticus]|uniref:Uncharacterized protein n=1 Tax=Hymenobacter endophyticus TaxID=3076335 RepID=A0ABU3TKV0_9BACT|nr:hypothetical protein [Hymenobacter endophyticus]MDU0372002.1 hypothetical protein [Hymenobacter endophyticus]
MTVSEFAALTADEKCNLIWCRGHFLANYVDGRSIFNLHYLHSFLVEIRHSPTTARVDSVIILDPSAVDTLYLYVKRLELPLDDDSEATAA